MKAYALLVLAAVCLVITCWAFRPVVAYLLVKRREKRQPRRVGGIMDPRDVPTDAKVLDPYAWNPKPWSGPAIVPMLRPYQDALDDLGKARVRPHFCSLNCYTQGCPGERPAQAYALDKARANQAHFCGLNCLANGCPIGRIKPPNVVVPVPATGWTAKLAKLGFRPHVFVRVGDEPPRLGNDDQPMVMHRCENPQCLVYVYIRPFTDDVTDQGNCGVPGLGDRWQVGDAIGSVESVHLANPGEPDFPGWFVLLGRKCGLGVGKAA